MQAELVDAADSLSGRLVELLGTWSEPAAWTKAVEGHASVPLDAIGQIARRVDRVEEVLEAFREHEGPERTGFDALRRRLIDHGIEEQMQSDEDDGV